MEKGKGLKKYNLISLVSTPLKAAPFASGVYLLMKAIGAVVPLIAIKLDAGFVDAVLKIKDKGINKALFWLILIALFIFISELVNYISRLLWEKIEIKLNEELLIRVSDKTSAVKYKYMENKEALDLISRVNENIVPYFSEGFLKCLHAFDMAIRVCGISIILIKGAWWGIILIFGFSIPLCIMAQKSGAEHYEAAISVTEKKRKTEVLNDILCSKDKEEERFLFGFSTELGKKWEESFKQVCGIQLGVRKKWFIKMKASGVFVCGASMLIIVSLLPAVISGSMSVGLFISLINAILELMQETTWGLTEIVDSLTRTNHFFKDLNSFFSWEEIDEEDKNRMPYDKEEFVFKSLVFRNTSFTYPDTEKQVLKNLFLEMKEGKHYALVGSNGEGKTTIIKLLLGLYDGYGGDILLNGESIRKVPVRERNQIFSVAFQDFVRYSMTVRENVELGNISHKEIKEEELLKLLDKVGLKNKIDSLSDGVEHVLGKLEKDGQDLSGGEWQKLAILRAMCSPAPVLLLDEPASALDPESERDIYYLFLNLMKEKTAVIISHRLGFTRWVDEILVLGNGGVLEKGTFDELISKKGIFYEMFESQKKWYGKQ